MGILRCIWVLGPLEKGPMCQENGAYFGYWHVEAAAIS